MDVDTGIDDALAILYACHSPELEIVGIGTIGGNITADAAALNTLRVLETVDAVDGAIPVAVGASEFLTSPVETVPHIHGEDGLGNTNLPAPEGSVSKEHAVDQLIRLAGEFAGELTIVATGPLTNVALALKKDADLAHRVAEVIVMGGTLHSAGNRTPIAEANFSDDPEAAAIVLAAPWKVTVVGLNVTHQTIMDDEMWQAFHASGTASGRFAHDISKHYLDVYEKMSGRRTCALHDPLAVAVAADPTLIDTVETWATVELKGEHTRGMLVCDVRSFAPKPKKPVHVAIDVDADRFEKMAMKRIPGID